MNISLKTYNGSVKTPNLGTLNDLNNPNLEVVLKTPSGELKTVTLLDFITAIVDKENIDQCTPQYSAAPYWMTKPEVLYTVCSNVYCGLGTANPEHKLHVIGTTFSLKFLAGNPGAPNDAMINGYVQGTSTPLVKLGQQTGSLAHTVRFAINNEGNILMINVGSQASLELNNGTGHAIVVRSNSGNKILQLEDNGLLRSRKIKIDEDNWADYVFEEGYELMSLNEIEKFIQCHGHLPGVKSAEEVKTEGLDVADMQRSQMEKIEELYLHLFQLEKRINELEKENETLKNAK